LKLADFSSNPFIYLRLAGMRNTLLEDIERTKVIFGLLENQFPEK
jgi:hypothetical protein